MIRRDLLILGLAIVIPLWVILGVLILHPPRLVW